MNRFRSERIRVLKMLIPFLKEHKWLTISIAAFKFFAIVLLLIIPLFYKLLINSVILDRKLHLLVIVVMGYIGIYILQTIVTIASKYMNNKFTFKLRLVLKNKIMTIYTKMKTVDYEKYNIGDLKGRLEDDTKKLEVFYNSHCLDYIFAIVNVVALTVIMYLMNWYLTLFGLVMISLSYLFSRFMGKTLKKISDEYREEFGKYEGFIQRSLQNWKEIKSNNLEEDEGKILYNLWGRLSKLFIRRKIYMYLHGVFLAFKIFFITRMSLYFFGGILIIYNKMDVATMLVFMAYYEQFFSIITTITNLIVELHNDIPHINRVFEILGYPVDEKLYTVIDGNISVNNVNFSYDNSQAMVLKDINFRIHKKEHIAVVGRSGSGKTTLAKLLLGIYEPQSGSIYIGDNGINQVSQLCLNRKISSVMQDPMFFNASIKDNLTLVKPDASMDEIDHSCKMAYAYDFIQDLPDNYDTIIGERGIKLSGGQKQRLAIARTLLLNPDIIIFDEATSSLDHESEKKILSAIKDLSLHKTIITIAHRFSTIIDSDRVIVLKQGRIIAEGHYKDLLNGNDEFSMLFKKREHSLMPDSNL